MTCPTCNGEGRVPASLYYDLPATLARATRCRSCSGTGYQKMTEYERGVQAGLRAAREMQLWTTAPAAATDHPPPDIHIHSGRAEISGHVGDVTVGPGVATLYLRDGTFIHGKTTIRGGTIVAASAAAYGDNLNDA